MDPAPSPLPSPPPPAASRRAAFAAALQSLKWRLTAGTLLALTLGLLALGAALLGRAGQDTVDAQRVYEIGDAAQTAAVLSRRVIEQQRALQAVAGRLDARMLDDDTRLFGFFADQPLLLSMFHQLAVTGVDGHARLRHDARGLHRAPLYLGDSDQLRQTVAEGRPLISPPLPGRMSRRAPPEGDEGTGEPIVVLTQPLANASGVYGVMVGTVQLVHRELLADLVDFKREDGRALMVVTDGEGRILVHPDSTRLLKPLADEPHFAQAHARWVAAGRPIEPAGLSFEQPGALVTAAGVAGPDWVVWRALPEDQLLAPLQAARGFALAWGGGLLAAMALMILGLIGLELRPLARLERRARLLFDGALPPGAGWPAARGEIGSLAAVLKQAAIDRAELEARNRQTLRRLEWSATHDALTGLANREALDARLAQLFEARALAADGDEPPARTALVAIDLDRFKPINDHAGHAAGDEVLKAVATAIAGCVRAGDLVARTGGDEFAVLLERCGGDGAQRVADEIRRAIVRLAVPWQQRVLHVGASVGVAPLEDDITDTDHWKQAADIACYAAKAAGRGGHRTSPITR
ncbi:sensor domain-containing diguanylate cyclase [Aquabacterium humicola]|uniref:sensor domain-containing diguanylate cyclase n=1 Tax=Aquabacterium humicola TaxID=3237377 RepID=UPI0025427D88|nr:sensor domain-containing diguanylate cyclase [Rubrivivax pictus]